MNLKNNYFLFRHGESKSNKEEFVSSWPEKIHNPLTSKGVRQVKRAIKKLKKENIDLIFSSDLLRCKQTAEMVVRELNLKVIFDKKLRERDYGILNGKSVKEWHYFFNSTDGISHERTPGGENIEDIKKRIKDFLSDIEAQYENKNILVISHGHPLLVFWGITNNFSEKEFISNKSKPRNAEIIKIKK